MTISFAGAKPVRTIAVSALLDPDDPDADEGRFSALRSFKVETCDGRTANCALPTGWRALYTSPADAFPSIVPRPLAPDLTLRTFDVPDTTATQIRFTALDNQCTGAPGLPGRARQRPAQRDRLRHRVRPGHGPARRRVRGLRLAGAYGELASPAMKAVQFSEYGDPDVLRVADVEEPHAGPGQIRIAVRAASVNAIDWKKRSGMLAEVMPVELPHVPGYDAAGVVDEVGDGVEGVAVGDEVFGFTAGSGGGYAEYALLDRFAAKPPELSFEEAAGYPVAVETSARVLDLLGDGESIVVNGAAGGVGTAGVQLARERGMRVIGTAREEQPRVPALARGRADDLRRRPGRTRARARRRRPRVRRGRLRRAARADRDHREPGQGRDDRGLHGGAIRRAGERRGRPRRLRARRGGQAGGRGHIQPAGDAVVPVRRGGRRPTARAKAATSAASSS